MKHKCYYDDLDTFGYAFLTEEGWEYKLPEGKKFLWNKAERLILHDMNCNEVYTGDMCLSMDTHELLILTFNSERLKYNLVNEYRTFDNEEFLEIDILKVSNVHIKDKKVHSVFVDGTEINDNYLTLDDALEIFDCYKDRGYVNVYIGVKNDNW